MRLTDKLLDIIEAADFEAPDEEFVAADWPS
jgi:hypothetical protein